MFKDKYIIFLFTVFPSFVSFIISFILADRLSSISFGEYSFYYQVINVFVLISDFGLTTTYMSLRYKNKNDDLFYVFIFFKIISAFFFVFIYLIYVNKDTWYIYGLLFFGLVFYNYIPNVLRVKGKYFLFSITKAIPLLVILLLVYFTKDLDLNVVFEIYAYTFSIFVVFSFLIIFIYFRNIFAQLSYEICIDVVRHSKWIFMASIIISLLTSFVIEMFYIKHFLNNEYLGTWSLYLPFHMLILMASSFLTTYYLPKINGNDFNELVYIVNRIFNIIVVISIIFAIVVYVIFKNKYPLFSPLVILMYLTNAFELKFINIKLSFYKNNPKVIFYFSLINLMLLILFTMFLLFLDLSDYYSFLMLIIISCSAKIIAITYLRSCYAKKNNS